MDLRLNLNTLQRTPISNESSAKLESINVLQGGHKGQYKAMRFF